MEKFVVIVLCLLITDQMLLAQNHVINSGFEEKYRCPTTQSQIQYSLNWGYKIVLKNSSISTPDYYHTCSNTDRLAKKWLNNMTEVGITENLNGVQPPHSGNAYAGIAIFDVGPEWLQTKLKFPLKQGQKYYAEYYVSLADNENYASNALGISFSEKDICKESRKHNDLSYLGTYIQNETGNYLADKESWTKISGYFIAKGGEEYLLIGSFIPPVEMKFKYVAQVKKTRREKKRKYFSTYYYIDDVKVVPVDSLGNEIILYKDEKQETIVDINSDTIKIETDKPIPMRNVFFATDSDVLLPESNEELDKLFKFLNDNSEFSIQIDGHTDNSGAEEHNKKLSESRSKAVANYLLNKGIAPNRISTTGFGSLKPIDTNETTTGKANNRRVEITLKSK